MSSSSSSSDPTSSSAGTLGYLICDESDLVPYNIDNHAAALALVFLFSVAGSILPLIISRFPWIQPHQLLVTFGNFFGTGVLIATAFVHLIPRAVYNLNNPCLQKDFASIASLLVMFAVFAMHLVEFIVAKKIGALPSPEDEVQGKQGEVRSRQAESESGVAENGAVTNQSSVATIPQTNNVSLSHLEESQMAAQTSVFYLFEMGVAVHSVLMGVSLGVLTSNGFLMLFISLCFHQFFEGFALGSAVTTVETTYANALKVVFAFSLASPLGIVVGIGLRQIFYGDYKSSLYLLGTTEALASGILIYTGLIELLTYGLTLNPHFSSRSASKLGTFSAFLGLYGGCTIIALHGQYAE